MSLTKFMAAGVAGIALLFGGSLASVGSAMAAAPTRAPLPVNGACPAGFHLKKDGTCGANVA